MKFLKRVAGMLGLAKPDAANAQNEEEDEEEGDAHDDEEEGVVGLEPIPGPRKGFSVPVKVKVGSGGFGPVVVACDAGGGGVQGFRWYADRLRIDEDGDVADEFVNEASSELLTCADEQGNVRSLPRFQVNCSHQPAKVIEHARIHGGRLQLCVESQGRLHWV